MKKENLQNQSIAIKIEKLKLSKIPMVNFRQAELQAIEIHVKHHKSYQPISYKTFCAYINDWEKFGENSFLFEIALPLFHLFEKDFWEDTYRDVYLNLFTRGIRANGKWLKEFLALYKISTTTQQQLLSKIFNDVFDVSLEYIISNNFVC